MVQVAVRGLPEPVSAAVLQVLMIVPPSVNLTVPVGALPLTVAVNVTLVPINVGFAEVEMVVVECARFMTCDRGALLDAAFPASPE